MGGDFEATSFRKGRYDKIRDIGRGAYSQVVLVRDVATGERRVIKRVYDIDSSARNEVDILRRVRDHPNIVRFYESFQEKEGSTAVLHIVMEYCEGGDLGMFLQERRPPAWVPNRTLLDWFGQLVEGVHFLHSRNVLHRDLKTANIFIAKGGSSLKIADFGISRSLARSQCATTMVGTPFYMAPEVVNLDVKDGYDAKSDVWSLGVITYELCTLQLPFPGANVLAVASGIMLNNPAPLPDRVPHRLKTLLPTMMATEAAKRPSMEEVRATWTNSAAPLSAATPSASSPPSEARHGAPPPPATTAAVSSPSPAAAPVPSKLRSVSAKARTAAAAAAADKESASSSSPPNTPAVSSSSSTATAAKKAGRTASSAAQQQPQQNVAKRSPGSPRVVARNRVKAAAAAAARGPVSVAERRRKAEGGGGVSSGHRTASPSVAAKPHGGGGSNSSAAHHHAVQQQQPQPTAGSNIKHRNPASSISSSSSSDTPVPSPAPSPADPPVPAASAPVPTPSTEPVDPAAAAQPPVSASSSTCSTPPEPSVVAPSCTAREGGGGNVVIVTPLQHGLDHDARFDTTAAAAAARKQAAASRVVFTAGESVFGDNNNSPSNNNNNTSSSSNHGEGGGRGKHGPPGKSTSSSPIRRATPAAAPSSGPTSAHRSKSAGMEVGRVKAVRGPSGLKKRTSAVVIAEAAQPQPPRLRGAHGGGRVGSSSAYHEGGGGGGAPTRLRSVSERVGPPEGARRLDKLQQLLKEEKDKEIRRLGSLVTPRTGGLSASASSARHSAIAREQQLAEHRDGGGGGGGGKEKEKEKERGVKPAASPLRMREAMASPQRPAASASGASLASSSEVSLHALSTVRQSDVDVLARQCESVCVLFCIFLYIFFIALFLLLRAATTTLTPFRQLDTDIPRDVLSYALADAGGNVAQARY